ncbi:MAG: 23S rRNA pseudouridine(1911/1915/1917) synthase RluD [Pseudomonadales bacterium]|nr:23S rRNA pseudouridine(1911/1915/1917) synthase RluD [Pseudomonadales bacterium]
MSQNTPEKEHIQLSAETLENQEGERLDVAVSKLFSQYSRSRLQQWIKSGHITLDGKAAKTREKVFEGQLVVLDVVLEAEPEAEVAEDIDLDIIYEDDQLLVINKPVGLVVHPGAGNSHGTLLNGLLYHFPALANVPRAGVVHRLDKDTSGLMVVAKTLEAHSSLVNQLQARTVSREYYALVQGVMTAGGTVERNIGRHPTNRQKQAVVEFGGKEAITHYRVVKRFRAHTLVRCKLETGRTHQIRVHMAYIRFPLIGDKTYAGRPKIPKQSDPLFIEVLQQFPRQALHAWKLGLIHPESGEYCEWEVDLAEDIQELMAIMKQDLLDHKHTGA